MGLLHDIQKSLLREGTDIGPVFLQLRFLAARLNSDVLEKWVKYEAEGYPADAALPDYRKLSIVYTGTFIGPSGSGVENAPIPPALITECAGREWSQYQLRSSIAEIESLIASTADGGKELRIDTRDLMIMLQGKIYQKLVCNAVYGRLSRAELQALQSRVKHRVLELTMKLEKSISAAADIDIEGPSDPLPKEEVMAATEIAKTVIHGDYHDNRTQITNSGAAAQITLNIEKGNLETFKKALIEHGVPESAANDLARIIQDDKGATNDHPFGPRTKSWIKHNTGKIVGGAGQIGIDVLTAAIKQYLGF